MAGQSVEAIFWRRSRVMVLLMIRARLCVIEVHRAAQLSTGEAGAVREASAPPLIARTVSHHSAQAISPSPSCFAALFWAATIISLHPMSICDYTRRAYCTHLWSRSDGYVARAQSVVDRIGELCRDMYMVAK